MIPGQRIRIVRQLRQLSKTQLAGKLGVDERTIRNYESIGAPERKAELLSQTLDWPREFFISERLLPVDEVVSFRADRKISAKARDSARAAAVISTELIQHLEQNFNLPDVDVPDLSGEDPEEAARLLRSMWNLGNSPLPNLVQLCESRGISVVGLPRQSDAIDAISMWMPLQNGNPRPIICCARRRSPEGVRFDLAHEIGHLVLHQKSQKDHGELEKEADEFASEFLIPTECVHQYLPHAVSYDQLFAFKRFLKVSALAATKKAHKCGKLTEWGYRQTIVRLKKEGFFTDEPDHTIGYERSRVFDQVLSEGRIQGQPVTIRLLSEQLGLPHDLLNAFTLSSRLHSV